MVQLELWESDNSNAYNAVEMVSAIIKGPYGGRKGIAYRLREPNPLLVIGE